MLKDADPGPGVAPVSYNLVAGSVERVKARLTEAIQDRDHEKSKILANINKAFESTVSKAAPVSMKEAVAALSRLQALVEDSIKKIVNSANSSQHNEAHFFEEEAKKLESDLVVRINENVQHEIQELQDLRSELAVIHNDREEGSDDETKHESTTASRPSDVKGGYSNQRDSVATPDGSGKTFAKIWRTPRRRTEKPEKRAPPETSSDGFQPPATWNRRNTFKLPAGGSGSPAGTDSPELSEDEMMASQASIRSRPPQRSPQARPKETEKPNLLQSHGQEDSRSGGGKYDHLGSLIGDTLELADQINQDFFTSMKEADDPDTDDWQTEQEEQSVELVSELAKVKKCLGQQNKVIEEQQKEIEILVTEKEAFETESQNLRAALGNMPQGIADTGIPTGGPPESTGLASAASAKSFRLSRAGSNVSTPGIAQVPWLGAWLPNSLQSHRDRLHSALERCRKEERSCADKMSVLAGDEEAEAGKKFLQIHMDSSRRHGRDFILTADFLDDLGAQLKKGPPPASVPLEEEIGWGVLGMESMPPTSRSEISPGSSLDFPDQDSATLVRGSVSTEKQGFILSEQSGPSTPPSLLASTALVEKPTSPGEARGYLPSPPTSRETPSSPGEAQQPPSTPRETRQASSSPRLTQPATSPITEGQKASSSPRETKEASPSPRQSQEAPPPGSEVQNVSKSDNDDQQDPPDEQPNDSEPKEESVEPQSPSSNVVSIKLSLWIVFDWTCRFIIRQFTAWFLVMKFCLLVIRYAWARGTRGRVGNQQNRAVQFPTLPPTGAWMIVVHHCLIFTTAQVYVACQREKHIWFEANGLTRRYMLDRYRTEASWLKMPVIDGNLVYGLRDLWQMAVWLVKCVVAKLQAVLESDSFHEGIAYLGLGVLVLLPRGWVITDYIFPWPGDYLWPLRWLGF
ncbi:hypothetical protein ACJ41O_009543 [Fusarium nematophilum]